MIFENLVINRVTVHEVFQRQDDRSLIAPSLGTTLEQFDADAITALRVRATDALSGKGLQMRIAKFGKDSFVASAAAMLGARDEKFVVSTQGMANKLAEAQLYRSIPGGILVVFDGTVGGAKAPFVCAIKAETQPGFRRRQVKGKSITEFLKDLWLTPAVKLYKIGFMVRDKKEPTLPDGWRAFVFDRNISPANREAAAAYFYDSFLGCQLPSDGAYETMKFFDITKEFVRASDLEPEKKRDVIDSLYVFVRDEQAPVFTAGEFADRFLPDELQDDYLHFVERKNFTPNAVVRDTSQMGTRLRRRRFTFGPDVELSASPEALTQKVTIEPVEGPPIDGTPQPWTRVTIRQPLTGER